MTLREAFRHSINIVAGRLAIDVTPATVAQTAMRLGISSLIKPVPSIALGISEVSLLVLTAAYAPFANGGTGVIASVIERIETVDGAVLSENEGIGPGQVVDPGINHAWGPCHHQRPTRRESGHSCQLAARQWLDSQSIGVRRGGPPGNASLHRRYQQ